MTIAELRPLGDAELDEVLRWRLIVLTRAGYDDKQAWALAERPEIDLHVAVELVARGCPAATATRILL